MSTPYLSEIKVFSFGFAPKGWAQCNGQLMSIQQNAALFSLLGTNYGGNGVTTFGLPDLRGRVPVHLGQGPGLSAYVQGELGGAETITLNSTGMPSHTHLMAADNEIGTAVNSLGKLFAQPVDTDPVLMYGPASSLVALNPGSVTSSGGNQPHSNMQPYLALNICIALQGIFPSRN